MAPPVNWSYFKALCIKRSTFIATDMPFPPLKFCCAVAVALIVMSGVVTYAQTSQPAASYIFPAGAQRGQSVDVRVGGLCLLKDPWFEISGAGVEAPRRSQTGDTIWFDGPMLTGAVSLKPDECPKDHQTLITVAEEADLGLRPWRVWTSQGATASRVFVIGELPEIIEHEIDGDPIPVNVKLPVTANGRIFPRTDLDIWTFSADAGETYTIELNAKSILSPLDARIALYADGKQLADEIGGGNEDPVIQFTAKVSGRHEVHVHDIGYGGNQSCVYRLTIRRGVHTSWVYPMGGRQGVAAEVEVGLHSHKSKDNAAKLSISLNPSDVGIVRQRLMINGHETEPVRLDVSNLPERLEVEPNDKPSEITPLATPVMLNGRIDHPGDVDLWPVAVLAGQRLELRLSAGRLGSSLLPLLDVVDADGATVAPTDGQPLKDNSASADVALTFDPIEDGIVWVRVKDRFESRGGLKFGYRLQVGTASPGFFLQLGADAITAVRGAETSLPIRVERFGGLSGPITVEVSGVPQGTELSDLVIPADKDEFSITFKPSETALIEGQRLQIHGTHTDDGVTTRRIATKRLAGIDELIDSVLYNVSVATPFKIKNRGPYWARVHAGTVYWHPFTVERNGHEGPITVVMADRQRRHLQGVQGLGEFHVPAGVTDFEFPFYLPPGMSADRLGRCLVMAIGEVIDEKGNRHQVVYADGEACQAPINPKAALLSLVVKQTSIFVQPNSTAEIQFNLQRDSRLTLPAKVEVIIPSHVNGVDADAVTLLPNDSKGILSLHIGSDPGPFNMPLTLRATIIENDDPVVAEGTIVIVAAASQE